MEHESKRGLQASSIARHINAVRAAIHHAIDTRPDLASFRLPRRPTLREANKQRMRILDEDEIKVLSAALASKPEWRDAYDGWLWAAAGVSTNSCLWSSAPTCRPPESAGWM